MTESNSIEPASQPNAAQLAVTHKHEITSRREQVNTLYLQGVSQMMIARQLGVTQGTVSRDLKALRDHWLEKSVTAISIRKAEELAKVDALELTYWRAWEESKKDREVIFSERVGEVMDSKMNGKEDVKEIKGNEGAKELKGQGENSKTETIVATRIRETTRREGQVGNPAFLDGVMKCIDKRCTIMGLNAPTRNFNVDLDSLSDSQLERLAAGEDIIDILSSNEQK